ncbi:uroporphyrinogen-III C-methyltransferase [Companilactobacillus sp.]|jgi:uroporphyrinogen III methyltransferase/synthase|uniref:uroporphyrinogen-III C-methyltransferase n=1 Tax=Companilactobacillus sp. TaxID=2767905 RepID=UPI0025BD1099|nr:uroporphyrinogen-III C-methyltransferase [Companilactobacillus sp.]MCH4008620.1 uroporphyrinogen-III C-methyltransferase [Companilactobacillus sp.]MCH4051201.1 uroporphyrinogen-III C-methyltransferase [Companilactobacillus sp.]MCH4076563.1 uroporphyrinogen-III C-methyltransferase [Companilactobacillus sp.]MCH4125138.1 uroporphyrinogen-III C-methyltransferase [Companilactobacillus sp.]MCH4131678.1 uroporphyrinogen-III C-methyltransferase [Companilactobacillus sp.]
MNNGLVSLVGAGPGDPELLTVKGKRRIQEADVVMFDRLIDPSILSYAKADAELINVGKLPHHHRVKQSQINQMLVDYSLDEKRVVRLKAGDPYVLGRGGEEAQFLTANGINYEVVPGLTSAIAGLAAAGIPVTHRDYASSFHVISAHLKKENGTLDWPNIAHQEGTLIFLMGMENLDLIVSELLNNGRSDDTPVAIIQWATQWRQKNLISNLKDVRRKVEETGIGSPSIIAVGDVVKLHQEIDYILPLFGQRILIADNSSHKLVHELRDHGASVVTYRRGKNEKTAFDIGKIMNHQQICFEDVDSFEFFIDELNLKNRDLRSIFNIKMLATSDHLAKKMKKSGVIADQVVEIEDVANTDDTVVLGSNTSEIIGYKNFDSVYHRRVSSNENIDFSEFSKLLFISKSSVTDLLDSIIEEKIPEIQNIPALAMGKKVEQLLISKGFTKVKLVKPKNSKVLEELLEEVN